MTKMLRLAMTSAARHRRLALARGRNEAVRARGSRQRRRAARRGSLRKETIKIGAKFKGRSGDQLLQAANAAATASNYKDAAEASAPRSPPTPKDPARVARARQARARPPTTPRRRTATNSSAAPATAAYAAYRIRQGRAPRRPRRWPRSAISRRATNPGASRSTPIRPSLDRQRQSRRARDLRGPAREARLPHRRLQGRQRSRQCPASASTSPIRWRARPISRLTSPSPAPPMRRSPTRTSSSASRASNMASATPS